MTSDADLTQSSSMPLMCGILSMMDHFLMTILMLYLTSLSIYLLTRKLNLPISTHSHSSSEVNMIVPQFNFLFLYISAVWSQHWWVSLLLIPFPPLMSALLCVPASLLHITHPLSAIPGGSLWKTPVSCYSWVLDSFCVCHLCHLCPLHQRNDQLYSSVMVITIP